MNECMDRTPFRGHAAAIVSIDRPIKTPNIIEPRTACIVLLINSYGACSTANITRQTDLITFDFGGSYVRELDEDIETVRAVVSDE